VWLLAAGGASATITLDPWSPLYRGIDFASGQADTNEVRQQKVFALRVDLADPTVEFFSTPSNGAGDLETFGQTTTTFVNTYRVAVGVNANFFSPVSTIPNDPRELSGLAVSQGNLVSPFESIRPSVLFTRSNVVSFVTSSPSLTNVWTAVSGSNIILTNGVPLLQSCTTDFCNENPRTAVGLSQDGHYCYLMVIDGRQPGWSDGATLYETGQWLFRLGAWTGLNFDGGGSSAMARLTNGTAVLFNRPSGGVQRVDGNHLGVFAQPLAPMIAAQPGGRTVFLEQPAPFSVQAVGAPPLSYQWRFNGTNLLDATNSAYSIASVQMADAGSYSVVISNAFGWVASSNALLSVLPLVVAAGDDAFGQLNTPPAASYLVAIAAGGYHSLALRDNGTVVAWGRNLDGEGNVPVGLTNALAIAAGGYHSLALDANDKVSAWGANYYGQSTVPANLGDVWALAAGNWHSLALKWNGQVVAWGDNTRGQTSVPSSLSNVVRIAAGGSHSLALTADGGVVAWGDNLDADGNYVGQSKVPAGLSNVVAVAAGGWHSLALDAQGRVSGWGADNRGQATPPADLTNAVAIVAGAEHSVALRRDGSVVAWGNNWNGQCALPAPATNSIAIAAGDYFTLALLPNSSPIGRLLRPQRHNDSFSVVLQTDMRGQYSLEQMDSLTLTNWAGLPAVNGNGALLPLTDPAATNVHRFYRVRRW
jgi:exopolysaccharide biosynthesis protein